MASPGNAGVAAARPSRLFRERCAELSGILHRIDHIVPPQKYAGGRTRRLQLVVAKEVARLHEQVSRLSGDTAQGWDGLASLERLAQRLAGETLAAVGGVIIRAAELDGDTCNIADALITSISTRMTLGYELVTVPSGSEFIDLMSDVIRVRYPGTGVWDLPLSLHEFGHFLVTHLPRSSEPSVATIVEQERAERPYRGFFAEELWADTFATYVGGPAYALSALERFDVVRPDDDEKPSHPSPMKRAAAIRLTLHGSQAAWERKDLAAGSLVESIASSEQLWRDRLTASGWEEQPASEDVQSAERLAETFISILDRDWTVIRYDNASRAAAVRRGFEAAQPELPPGAGLIDVLNGGWWARRIAQTNLQNIQPISEGVLSMCKRIMANG
jgi:hypothetical protein